MPLFKEVIKGSKLGIQNAVSTLKRPRVLMVFFVLPIVLITIFGLSFTTMFEKEYDLKKIKAAVIFDFEPQKPSEYLSRIDGKTLISRGALMAFDDIEAKDFKRLIMSDLQESDAISDFHSVQELSKQEAFKLLRKDKLDILFVMDEVFYKNYIINTATPLKLATEIKIVTSDDNYLNRQISQRVMASFATQMERTWDVSNIQLEQVVASGVPFNRGSFIEAITDLFDTNLGPRAVTYKMELVAGRSIITAKEYYPLAITTMFWLFTAIYLARKPLTTIDEIQKQNDLPNVNPYFTTRVFWFTAWIEVFIVNALQFLVTFVWSIVILRTQWTYNFDLVSVLLLSLFAMASISVFLAACTLRKKSFQMLNILESLGAYVMSFIGGSLVPLALLPNIFKITSKLMPNGLILNAFVLQTQGYSYWHMRWDLWFLFGMAILAIALAVYNIKVINRQLFD